MKILLIGKAGQIGWELARSLSIVGDVLRFGRNEMDLRDQARVIDVLRATQPDVVVNAAAYTAVDRAEADPDGAYAVNASGPGVLAREVAKTGSLLVHYSTDYVFDGKKGAPYVESDSEKPINEYGRSKLAGEVAIRESGCRHIVIRTSWVYGARGSNFLLTILRLARERDTLRVVNDQYGAPTPSRLLADATAHIVAAACSASKAGLDAALYGTYHLTCSGHTSWYEFARRIVERAVHSHNVHVEPITSSEYRTAAERPSFSVLNCELAKRTFGLWLPDWNTALADVLDEVRQSNGEAKS